MLGINALQITPALLAQISELDEFKGLWKGLERHTTCLKFLSDVSEHGAELNRVLQPLQQKGLNTDILRILNAMQVGEKGLYPFRDKVVPLPFSRDEKVFGVLETAEADQIQPLLIKLCDWVNESIESKNVHPLIVTAVFAAIFLQIAPFDKGNQRTMRFLTVMLLLKTGYIYAPYVMLAPLMEERGEKMYKALRHNQESLEEGRPDWGQWLSFFLDVLLAQKSILHTRLYEQELDFADMPALSAKIMEQFKEHKRLQMKEIIKLTNGRRATIKLRLQELLDGGFIKRHGAGRATWYSLV